MWPVWGIWNPLAASQNSLLLRLEKHAFRPANIFLNEIRSLRSDPPHSKTSHPLRNKTDKRDEEEEEVA
jgi:hypothetical protein